MRRIRNIKKKQTNKQVTVKTNFTYILQGMLHHILLRSYGRDDS